MYHKIDHYELYHCWLVFWNAIACLPKARLLHSRFVDGRPSVQEKYEGGRARDVQHIYDAARHRRSSVLEEAPIHVRANIGEHIPNCSNVEHGPIQIEMIS